jgi:ribosomal protein S26
MVESAAVRDLEDASVYEGELSNKIQVDTLFEY